MFTLASEHAVTVGDASFLVLNCSCNDGIVKRWPFSKQSYMHVHIRQRCRFSIELCRSPQSDSGQITVLSQSFSFCSQLCVITLFCNNFGARKVIKCAHTCREVVTGRMPRSDKLPFLLTGQKSAFSPRRGDSLHRNLARPRCT